MNPESENSLLLSGQPALFKELLLELPRWCSQLGYRLVQIDSQRKTLAQIKQLRPRIIAAEFIYHPTYGSQLSNFESLIAANQKNPQPAGFLVIIHKDDVHHFERLELDGVRYEMLILPATVATLRTALQTLAATYSVG
ncbi:MAG: hypothetical protein OEY58_01085 [Gammaproteobacteria bacterium]|nr:hypothetical protein [Gammaproteobacteria bacterium]